MIQSRADPEGLTRCDPMEPHDDRSDWVHWSQFPEYECPTSDDEQEETVDIAFADTGRCVERAQTFDDVGEMGDGDVITLHMEQPEPSSLPFHFPQHHLPRDIDFCWRPHCFR